MTRPVASQRFRQRKLNTRTPLEVLREDQLDTIEPDQPNTPKVETGVEKHEETEHHLQAAISASHQAAVGGKVAQIYIPTPETVPSSVPYDSLYQLKFSQPATYIRFSSTVEDCCGCPYNMVDEDDVFLKAMNERPATGKRDIATQCSDDAFEEAMYFFEATAKSHQPFNGVGDPPPIITWEEMHGSFDESIEEPARSFARDIYDHWRARREATGNTAVQPGLKLKVIETANDADDNDPYVCFRRREVRQVRKTRGRDAQSVEKLKKLRKELEDARQLVALIRQRELVKRDSLSIDKQLFEQRTNLRRLKKTLPDQYREGDEDLLINQKPPKKKAPEAPNVQRAAVQAARAPGTRPDGRSSEADLVLLKDIVQDKENQIDTEIKTKIMQHMRWNENYVDRTRFPLTPPLEETFSTSFRPAVTEYLPTPPASVSSQQSGEAITDAESPAKPQEMVTVKYATPSLQGPSRGQIAFRRRIGRGGRQMIDRRSMHHAPKEDLEPIVAERFRYDYDDDEDDDIITYPMDPYNIGSMRYRAAIAGTHQHHAQQRRAQIEAASTHQQQHAQQQAQQQQQPQSQAAR